MGVLFPVLVILVGVVRISDVAGLVVKPTVVFNVVVVGVGARKVTFVIFPMPLVSLNVKVNLFPVEGDVKETAKFGDDCLGEQFAVDFPLILIINLQTYFLGPFCTSALKLSTYKLT